MKEKMLLLIAAFVVISSFQILANQALAEEKVVLKVPSAYSTFLPTIGTVLPFFAEKVKAISNGSIEVMFFEPGKLVPAFEVHDAVSTGKVNAGYTATGYFVGKFAAAEFFSAFPFGPEAAVYLGWFYYGNGAKLYQECYDRVGYNIKPFPFCFLSPESSGWFKKPINSKEDLRGLRLRYFGLGGKVLAKLGAAISTIPGGEVFPALERGAIDGCEFSTPAIDDRLGLYKAAKYNYFPAWHQPATHLEFIMNKDTWKTLSKSQQTAIETACYAANAYSISKSYVEQAKVIEANAEKHGVHNITWSNQMLELFQKTWYELAAEESDKDEFFKKVWDDLKAFMAEYESYGCRSSLPRTKCK